MKHIRVDAAQNGHPTPHFPCGVSVAAHQAVMRMIGDTYSDLASIASTIGQDEVMGEFILQFINSAAVGLPNRVTRVDHAVALLGTQRLGQYLRQVDSFQPLAAAGTRETTSALPASAGPSSAEAVPNRP